MTINEKMLNIANGNVNKKMLCIAYIMCSCASAAVCPC